jgi:prepilin-type N-terminal cleavage/methylation domain-containing protein
MKKIKAKGFTLIEILVVIGIIAVLAAIVLIAINPARQFAQANDSQRTSNLNAILNGVGQYLADNRGALPPAIAAMTVGATSTIAKSGGVDVCSSLVPTYIPSLPSDPKSTHNGASISDCASAYNTGYTVSKDSAGRVTVSAPLTEISATDISVTR